MINSFKISGRSILIARVFQEKIAPATFLLAPLLLVLSFGDQQIYRLGQVFWIGIMVWAGFLVTKRVRGRPSTVVLVLLGLLWLGPLLVEFRTILTGDRGISSSTVIKLASFSVLMLAVDAYRNFSLAAFLGAASPFAVAITLLTAAHFLISPIIVFGRHTFFGLHPNLGGEILFVCAVVIFFEKRSIVRWGGLLLICVLLFFLQTRAALLGFLIFWGLNELFSGHEARGSIRQFMVTVIGAISLIVIIAVPVFYPSLVVAVGDLVGSRILLLDDLNRGLGTGFVGRDAAWSAFGDIVAAHPYLGVGLDNGVRLGDKIVIHNGFLALGAEYGLFALGFSALVLASLWSTIRRDRTRFYLLLACLVIFFFNARTVNLNVFPFLLWMALLPWRAPEPRLTTTFWNPIGMASDLQTDADA